MKKASEYRRHAEDCRQLVRTADTDEHRELLINMATTWDALADERERMAKTGKFRVVTLPPHETTPPAAEKL